MNVNQARILAIDLSELHPRKPENEDKLNEVIGMLGEILGDEIPLLNMDRWERLAKRQIVDITAQYLKRDLTPAEQRKNLFERLGVAIDKERKAAMSRAVNVCVKGEYYQELLNEIETLKGEISEFDEAHPEILCAINAG